MFLGIDLGTSSLKMLLMDEHHQIVNVIHRQYPISYPKTGWAEQNPEDWFYALKSGLQELVKQSGEAMRQLRAIGIDGQMHGLVALDENDEVIRPAILWNDGRAQDAVNWLNDEVGRAKLVKETGNIAFAGFTAPKLLWMKAHEPELFDRIKKVMLPKDYLVYQLTGVFSTDYSDASGMLLLDVKNKVWSSEMLKRIGLTTEQLPTLYESWQVVGTVRPEICEAVGLRHTPQVVAGGSDNGVAAVGIGILGPHKCMVSLGTSGTILASGDFIEVSDPYGIHAFAHCDGQFHLLSCMLSAASCVNWWNEKILESSDYNWSVSLIEQCDRELYFLPYLMGERSPHNDTNAKGAFIGLTMETTRTDMSLAVMEGVAFGLRDSFEIVKRAGIQPTEVVLCGGGAKNELWQLILANVFNVDVCLTQSDEGAAMGAAMLAAVGVGAYPSVEKAAEDIVQIKKRIQPTPRYADVYEQKYRRFKQFYPLLKPMYQEMA